MKFKSFLLFIAVSSATLAQAQNQDSLMLRKIYDEALVNGQCYQNLHYLCKNIGSRLSGSPGAQKAVEWSKKLMDSYGFDRVIMQPVMVPHWVRGAKGQGVIIDGTKRIPVNLAALGMSVATPAAGVTANIIEVKSLQELATLGEQAIKGKIVFFNRPFDARYVRTLQAYSTAGDQRNAGPVEAAKYGAVAVLVRSLTESNDDFPHTGGTSVSANGRNIPAAALSTKASDMLSIMLKRRKLPLIKFYLKTNCQTLPDAPSFNVIGEINGTEHPERYIIAGGHLDSWDLAEGAHDDGAGVMQSVEMLRIFKAIGYRPKHSIRAVFFMNEENGHKGGLKYAELAKQNNEQHLVALETDLGGFTPRGFGFGELSPAKLKELSNQWKPLLEPYDAGKLVAGGGGTDIGPLKEQFKAIQLVEFIPDSQRYFDVHHAANDVFENVNKRELELGAAAIASLIYLIDNQPALVAP